MQYVPQNVPTDVKDIPAYLANELRSISAALTQPDQLMLLQKSYSAPAKPREGMIALADGSNWNPGLGAGYYGYIGSAWVKLSALGDISGITSIKFPAVQVPSSDVNALDDYEEGTWTPNQGSGLTVTGAFSSSGVYTKIGRQVHVCGQINGATSIAIAVSGIVCSNLPFTAFAGSIGGITNSNPNLFSNLFLSGTSLFSASALAASPTFFFAASYITST